MIAIDKLLHFLVGYSIATTLSISPIAGMVCVILAGAAKEGFDYISNKYLNGTHEVSYLDFITTIAGGIVGITLQYSATYFFTHFPQLLGM